MTPALSAVESLLVKEGQRDVGQEGWDGVTTREERLHLDAQCTAINNPTVKDWEDQEGASRQLRYQEKSVANSSRSPLAVF